MDRRLFLLGTAAALAASDMALGAAPAMPLDELTLEDIASAFAAGRLQCQT